MKNTIIVSGPVIVRDGKVLLDISSGDDFWKFCGGRVKDEEGLKETAIRRAKEELSIDVKIVKEEPFFMYVKKEKEDAKLDIILVHWLADYSGDISVGDDVEKFEWFKVDSLPSDTGPNIVPALQHFGFIKE